MRVAAAAAYWFLVELPALQVFRRGPRSLGMLGGRAPSDVCAYATGVPSAFWNDSDNSHQCELMIRRDLDSWLAIVMACIYVYMFASGVACMSRAAFGALWTAMSRAPLPLPSLDYKERDREF